MKQTLSEPVKVVFYPAGSWTICVQQSAIYVHRIDLAHAVESFRDFADRIDARTVFEIVGPAKVEAHRLLTS
jgi:hypothetical protein